MSVDDVTWIISSRASMHNIGDYKMIATVSDISSKTVDASFTLHVMNCYPNCITCKDTSALDCTSCIEGYFLYHGLCVRECPNGLYGVESQGKCLECDNKCTQCTGADFENQCNRCSNGFFEQENGCYEECPQG